MGFLKKHIQIYMQYYKTIGATSFELSRDKKLSTYEHTHAHTHIRTFSADDFFFNVDHNIYGLFYQLIPSVVKNFIE